MKSDTLVVTPSLDRPEFLERLTRSMIEHNGTPAEGGYSWILIDYGSNEETLDLIQTLAAELNPWCQILNRPRDESLMSAFDVMFAEYGDMPYRVYMENDYEWKRPGWFPLARTVLDLMEDVGQVIADHHPDYEIRREEGWFKTHEVQCAGHRMFLNTTDNYTNKNGEYAMRVHMCRSDLFQHLLPMPPLPVRMTEIWLGHHFHKLWYASVVVDIPHPGFAEHLGEGKRTQT